MIQPDALRSQAGLRVWLRQLRLHQWMKNFLIFVLLLTAFVSDRALVLTAVIAFLAFSLAASATYVFNDLWDLESDRVHPRRRFRPLVSGQIPILLAVVVASALLAVALALRRPSGAASSCCSSSICCRRRPTART